MRREIWLICMMLCAAELALADFDSDMLVGAALCNEKRHDEAVQAYVRLGEGCTDPEQRYQAFREAAVCARLHLGSEEKALKLAQQIKAEPYAKACRATVYQWTGSPTKVLAEFGNEDFSEWPEAPAAVGYTVRGAAYFNTKNGRKAAADYLRAFQFAKSYEKWAALQKLGDTYWKLLDDEVLAEACYRKCVSDFGGGWPGLQARVNLATLLLSQKRYDAALECLRGDKHDGYWKGALLYLEAKVYAEMGKKAEAIASLEEALATQGIAPSQKKECEELRSGLK